MKILRGTRTMVHNFWRLFLCTIAEKRFFGDCIIAELGVYPPFLPCFPLWEPDGGLLFWYSCRLSRSSWAFAFLDFPTGPCFSDLPLDCPFAICIIPPFIFISHVTEGDPKLSFLKSKFLNEKWEYMQNKYIIFDLNILEIIT